MKQAARAVAVALVVAACGSNSSSTGPGGVSVVTVSPALDTLRAFGATLQLGAVMTDGNGATLSGKTFAWMSTIPQVITVDANGLATAHANGVAAIVATADAISGAARIVVVQTAAVVAVSPPSTTVTGLGAATPTYSAVAKDANNNTMTGVTFAWSSSDVSVATIGSAGGAPIAKGLGTAMIRATAAGVTGNSPLTVAAHYYVNADTGSDAQAGTIGAPFKTISRALSVAAAGNTIKVQPGRYSTASGETFPLIGPDGVKLVADEATKGSGATLTTVVVVSSGDTAYTPVFAPPANALIAGFTITDSAFAGFAVDIRNSNVTLRNNRVVKSTHVAVNVADESTGHLISGNLIDSNAGEGLNFAGGGLGTGTTAKVENNTITNNLFGVEYGAPGGDLGGGAMGSAGGNILSCNERYDLYVDGLGVNLTVLASNNQWDHVPLTTDTGSNVGGGVDFHNAGGTNTLTSTGATVAANNCH